MRGFAVAIPAGEVGEGERKWEGGDGSRATGVVVESSSKIKSGTNPSDGEQITRLT